MSHVASCHAAADALVLPSLLESFTNTYADAMSEGVPVITSNLDFARTVCGEAACYIDPMDPASIVSGLDSLDADPEGWRDRIAVGLERSRVVFMDWPRIASRVIGMLECVASGQEMGHLLDLPWSREVIDGSSTVAALVPAS